MNKGVLSMKKFVFSMLVALIALSLAAPVLAAPGNKVVKGEVTAINNNGTFSVTTAKGETILIKAPEGFDLSKLKTGDVVLVKGVLESDGSLAAEWIKIPGPDDEAKDDAEKPEGDKEPSAYCTGVKQGEVHPVATKLSEKYGVTADWVMGYFCDGYSMGAIMLALKTSQLNGSDPEVTLAQRADGKGWGEIWQEMKLIGSEKDVMTPPGLLKKGKTK